MIKNQATFNIMYKALNTLTKKEICLVVLYLLNTKRENKRVEKIKGTLSLHK